MPIESKAWLILFFVHHANFYFKITENKESGFSFYMEFIGGILKKNLRQQPTWDILYLHVVA